MAISAGLAGAPDAGDPVAHGRRTTSIRDDLVGHQRRLAARPVAAATKRDVGVSAVDGPRPLPRETIAFVVPERVARGPAPSSMSSNTSFTNASSAGTARKLVEIACRGSPSGRSASMNSAASSSTATSASRKP